jgi:hypothetical protein
MAKMQRLAEMTSLVTPQGVMDNRKCAWPVIDATFRYSLFSLQALIAHAPFYSGILSGLAVSDVSPYS